MNLQALTERAANGEVRELELLSLEGVFYLERVRLDHGQFTLLDDIAKPMHLRSINQLLHLVPPFPCVLVQQCVHDEMCGSHEGPIESLRWLRLGDSQGYCRMISKALRSPNLS